MYDPVRLVSKTDPAGSNDPFTISIKLFFGIIKKKTNSQFIWEYNQCDCDQFRMKLSNCDWDCCFSFENINEITDEWSNIARVYSKSNRKKLS